VLLLWGDSHANQYLSALSEAALAVGQGGLIATQSGCRATLSGQTSGLPASIAPACEHFNDEVNTLIAQTPSLHTVVIGRLWSADDSQKRTIALVRQLVQQGKTVVLVGPLPEPGLDVPQMYAMKQIKAGRALDQWVIPLSTQSGVLALRQSLLKELSDPLRLGQVQFLDPLIKLCDSQNCRLAEGGEANFRDISHLSQRTSLKFAPDFQSALQALGQRPSDPSQHLP
jgi:hypothetical protein